MVKWPLIKPMAIGQNHMPTDLLLPCRIEGVDFGMERERMFFMLPLFSNSRFKV